MFRRLRQPPLEGGGGRSKEIDLSAGGSSSKQIDLSAGRNSQCIDVSGGRSSSDRIDLSGGSSSGEIDVSVGATVGTADISARARAKRPAARITTLDLTDDDAGSALDAAATLVAVGSSSGRPSPAGVTAGAAARGTYDLTSEIVDLTEAPTALVRDGAAAHEQLSSSEEDDEPLLRRRKVGERARLPAGGSDSLDGAGRGEVVWLS